MAERTYYVICEDNCKFESMTKEQIIAAITEATGSVPTGIDDAFISKIKEQNAENSIKVWVGSEAQYNALETKASDTLYFIKESGKPVKVMTQEVVKDYTQLENLPDIPQIITSGTDEPNEQTAGYGVTGSVYFKVLE